MSISEDPPSHEPRGVSSWKRRGSEIPLRQVRSDGHAHVHCCHSNIFYMYRDDLCIFGVEPTSLAGAVLRDLPSGSDVDYLHSLSWYELTLRSNSSNVEVILLSLVSVFLSAFPQDDLLNVEVDLTANGFRKQFLKESKAFETTTAALGQKLPDLLSLFEKVSANAKTQEEEMRLGSEAGLLKLKNELWVVDVHLEAAKK